MIEIPKQLEDQRFILINTNQDKQKVPLEAGWTKEMNYSFEEMQRKDIIKYGVMCGVNNLIVIDCDNEEFQKQCLKHEIFQNTFQVKTASSGLLHFYFYVDKENPETQRFKISKKETLADVQGIGTQVLGPGSTLDSINRSYEIVNNTPIIKTKYETLIGICSDLMPDIEIESKIKKSKDESNFSEEIDPVISYIKSKITIKDLLEEWGINTRKGANCDCPFHSSKSGQCFSYEAHQYNCFHCLRGGSMFDLVMEKENCSFMEAKTILSDKIGIPDKILKQARTLAIKRKNAETTEFLVNEFLQKNNIYTIRNDIKCEMWIYKHGIYVPHGKSYIGQYCRGILQKFYSSNILNIVIEKIMKDTMVEEDEFFQTNYHEEIPVINGILNIRTLKLSNFTPEKIFFNKLPVFFDPKQKCPLIKEFLKSTLDTTNDIKTIQEAFGYSLWKKNKYQKTFLFIGKADNGKSVLLDVFSRLIGIDNISNVTLQDIDGEKFAAAGLFAKMVNISAEVGKKSLDESSLFKSLVAGDQIEAWRKFRSSIKFKNYAKMFFATNNVPETVDKSDGFFKRWCVIQFPYSFKREKDFNNLTSEELETGNYKLADPHIIDKLTTQQEMSGFLNYILKGLHRLWKNDNFSKSPVIKEIKEFWQRNENTMRAFIIDKIEITYNYDDYVTTDDLNCHYIKYCQDNSILPEIKKNRTKILNEYPLKYKNKYFMLPNKIRECKKVWEGMRLRK